MKHISGIFIAIILGFLLTEAVAQTTVKVTTFDSVTITAVDTTIRKIEVTETTVKTTTQKILSTIVKPVVVILPNINKAFNKPTIVSSLETPAWTGNLAVDENLATRWASELYKDPQWFVVDLGKKDTVDRIHITWEFAMAKDYLLQTSLDNKAWKTIKTVVGNTIEDNNHTSLKASGRYIRMYGTKRGSQWGYSIREFKVYSGSQTEPVDTVPIPPIPVPSTGYLSFPLYNGVGTITPGVARVKGDNILIKGYRFSNKNGGVNNGHCLWLEGNGIIVEDCYFEDSEGLAIYVSGGSNNTLQRNFSAHVNWGFLIQRTTGNIKIINNQFINMIWDRQVQGCCRGATYIL